MHLNKQGMNERWAGMARAVASFMFLWAMGKQFIPADMQEDLTSLANKVISFIDPYEHITIPESDRERIKDYKLYIYAEAYLGSCCSDQANRLKLSETFGEDSYNFSVTIDINEDVMDQFGGIKIWWVLLKESRSSGLFGREVERRYLRLSFHKSHHRLVVESYLHHVLEEGRAIRVKNRKQMLFTNEPSKSGPVSWRHMVFHHPSTFDTLAMAAIKKKEIIDDLVAFRKGSDYYSRIGKVWKRGYLLYGPAGTGKSSLIAAIANFLKYDVYDLELTAVKSNAELRKLFIQTTGKSIIVIEDIDCSLEFTRNRIMDRKTKSKTGAEAKMELLVKAEEEEPSKVTLSGILNVIDGLWSSCSGERIIIFTTNHKEKLDPALIRRGRMDMLIEMSYCGFDAFKVLAKNYLNITDHQLFDEIRELLQEMHITTADMAENLMVKSKEVDVEACLQKLIKTLTKEKARQVTENWVRLV